MHNLAQNYTFFFEPANFYTKNTHFFYIFVEIGPKKRDFRAGNLSFFIGAPDVNFVCGGESGGNGRTY